MNECLVISVCCTERCCDRWLLVSFRFDAAVSIVEQGTAFWCTAKRQKGYCTGCENLSTSAVWKHIPVQCSNCKVTLLAGKLLSADIKSFWSVDLLCSHRDLFHLSRSTYGKENCHSIIFHQLLKSATCLLKSAPKSFDFKVFGIKCSVANNLIFHLSFKMSLNTENMHLKP